MGFEGYSKEWEEKIKSVDVMNEQRSFEKGQLLPQELYNQWLPVGVTAERKSKNGLLFLKPFPLHDEFFEQKALKEHNTMSDENAAFENAIYVQNRARVARERSDPGLVKRYDALVSEFNNDLQRIKEKRDFAALSEYFRDAEALIRKRRDGTQEEELSRAA